MKKNLKKNCRVLFLGGNKPSLEFMNECLQIYTLNNGGYPNEIHMTKNALAHYRNKLQIPEYIKSLSFHGITVKLNAPRQNLNSQLDK